MRRVVTVALPGLIFLACVCCLNGADALRTGAKAVPLMQAIPAVALWSVCPCGVPKPVELDRVWKWFVEMGAGRRTQRPIGREINLLSDRRMPGDQFEVPFSMSCARKKR